MHYSKVLVGAAALSTVAAQILGPDPVSSYNVEQVQSAVESDIPSAIRGSIPDETQGAQAVAQYLTSITAQPAYSTAIAALQTAAPSSVQQEINDAPGSFLLDVATGTEPSYLKSLPTNVYSFIESIGEQCLSILEGGSVSSSLPAGLLPSASAVPTGAYSSGYSTGTLPTIIYRTGVLPTGVLPPTGVFPTGVLPTGFLPSGATGASGTGIAGPTANLTSYTGGSPSPSVQTFPGAAAPRDVALGLVALAAGAATLFVC